MTDSLVKIQQFTIYNTTRERMMFPGLIIPANESRTTTDASLFELPAVKKALERGAIEVTPDPRLYYGAESAVPETGDSGSGGGSGGGGGTGDGNIVRSFRNFDSIPLPRGSPVFSPNPGQGLGAVGNSIGRNVIGLYAGSVDWSVGSSGDVLVEGTLAASISEWEMVTDMPGGLVRGRKYFLDLTVPGKLRLNVQATSGPAYMVCVGYALSSTEFKLEIQPTIRIA